MAKDGMKGRAKSTVRRKGAKKPKTPAKKPAEAAPKRRRGERGPEYTDEAIIQALDMARGFISIAARSLGCSQNTIRERIRTSKAVAEAYEDINESNVDLSESKLLLAIDRGDVGAIKFHLEHKGQKRGYGDRHELEIKTPGAAILEQVTVADIDRILALRGEDGEE